MLELFDRNRVKVAILQNAFNLVETERINSIGTFYFSLPDSDAKNDLIKQFFYIRYNNGELYRVLNGDRTVSEDGIINYKCEHVLSTLMDTVMFSFNPIVVGNLGYYTEDVIRFVLSHQKNWVLDRCDFRRQFEYSWESENLLSALFSVATPFSEDYIWETDTRFYPWKISLIKLDKNINPEMYIRKGKNVLKITTQEDLTKLATRLYCLGAGEGINQVNIKEVNGGLPYIESSNIGEYGLIERIWTDRRYENPESLLAAGRAMLDSLSDPYVSYTVNVADLGLDSLDIPRVGKVVEVVGYIKTYIVGVTRNHDEVLNTSVEIANRSDNLAGTVADLADRQRIEMNYAQGATQIYTYSQPGENADKTHGTKLPFYIPPEMITINKVLLKAEMTSFRAYGQATEGGGALIVEQINNATSSQSSITTTYSGGGGTSGSSSRYTTENDGAVHTSTGNPDKYGETDNAVKPERIPLVTSHNATNVRYGTHYIDHDIHLADWTWTNDEGPRPHEHWYDIEISRWQLGINDWVVFHEHTIDFPDHTHKFKLPDHAHEIRINGHVHSMDHTHWIDSHTHGFNHTHSIAHTHTLPAHIHAIKPGIYNFGNPKNMTLKVNGVQKTIVAGYNMEVDITNWLVVDKKIPRGTWHEIEILPDDLAHISAYITIIGFIQSRGDMTV